MKRNPMTPELLARILQLHSDGLSTREIGCEVGRRHSTVADVIYRVTGRVRRKRRSKAAPQVHKRRPLPVVSEEALKRFHAKSPTVSPKVQWHGIVPPPMVGEYEKCPGCHSRVRMPCLKCQLHTAGFVKERSIWDDDDDPEPTDDDSAVRLPDPAPEDSAVNL